jgi:hypothetical protein
LQTAIAAYQAQRGARHLAPSLFQRQYTGELDQGLTIYAILQGCICEREIIKTPSQLLLLKTSISPTASFTVLGR